MASYWSFIISYDVFPFKKESQSSRTLLKSCLDIPSPLEMSIGVPLEMGRLQATSGIPGECVCLSPTENSIWQDWITQVLKNSQEITKEIYSCLLQFHSLSGCLLTSAACIDSMQSCFCLLFPCSSDSKGRGKWGGRKTGKIINITHAKDPAQEPSSRLEAKFLK